jgi:hypothetical protein
MPNKNTADALEMLEILVSGKIEKGSNPQKIIAILDALQSQIENMSNVNRESLRASMSLLLTGLKKNPNLTPQQKEKMLNFIDKIAKEIYRENAQNEIKEGVQNKPAKK